MGYTRTVGSHSYNLNLCPQQYKILVAEATKRNWPLSKTLRFIIDEWAKDHRAGAH